MHSKVKTCLAIFIGFLVFVGVFGTGFATATVLNQRMNPQAEESDAFDLFWEVWGLIQRDFYGELPSDAQVTYGAIRGSLATLDDPYSIFIEPQPREMERDSLRGSFGGIGAYILQTEEGDFVLDPIDESQPASVAGILTGDILLSINGEPVSSDMTVDDIVLAIRGPVGEDIVLTIHRPETGQELELTITRAIIMLPSVAWEILEEDPTIGYIWLTRFTERSAEEVGEAITDLQTQGAEKLILDLRNNGGGLLQAAIDVADHFLENQVVLYQLEAGKSEKSYRVSSDGNALEMPLVILVNGGTASASEIVAGALQDHGRAQLVGEVTFGKGSVQHIYDLSDGSSLHVTSARWFTPERRQLDGQGLTPDEIVSLDESGHDLQLARAIELLQETE